MLQLRCNRQYYLFLIHKKSLQHVENQEKRFFTKFKKINIGGYNVVAA